MQLVPWYCTSDSPTALLSEIVHCLEASSSMPQKGGVPLLLMQPVVVDAFA